MFRRKQKFCLFLKIKEGKSNSSRIRYLNNCNNQQKNNEIKQHNHIHLTNRFSSNNNSKHLSNNNQLPDNFLHDILTYPKLSNNSSLHRNHLYSLFKRTNLKKINPSKCHSFSRDQEETSLHLNYLLSNLSAFVLLILLNSNLLHQASSVFSKKLSHFKCRNCNNPNRCNNYNLNTSHNSR